MARRRQALVLVAVALPCIGFVGVLHSLGAARGAPHTPTKARSTNPKAVDAPAVSLAPPDAIGPFHLPPTSGEGQWRPVGRRVDNLPAVYETTVRLPSNAAAGAGIAWMDTKLLRARLYSGSLSPGGLFWKYTAPISPAASQTLVAAFNGGFLLKDTNGGYFSERHLVAPLRTGAASLVIFKNGSATVGEWGRDLAMTPAVVAVRQNLTLLIDHGQPVAGLNPNDVSTWGVSLHGVVDTWRSGLGETANGALVYVSGQMTIVDLADILARAGSVRAMVLDMNPNWTVFSIYAPTSGSGAASPSNGSDLLPAMLQTPARFFEPAYSRDFVTMSAP